MNVVGKDGNKIHLKRLDKWNIENKNIFRLDSLERVEPSILPDGYVLSRCVAAIIDLTQAMFAAVDSLSLPGDFFIIKFIFWIIVNLTTNFYKDSSFKLNEVYSFYGEILKNS